MMGVSRSRCSTSKPIEEGFVAVQQGDQADVLFQRVALLEDVLQLHRDLLLDGEHCGRQQPFDAELRRSASVKAASLFWEGSRRSAPRATSGR